jgi:hypothetical protein
MEIYQGAITRVRHTIYSDDVVVEADGAVLVTILNSAGDVVVDGAAASYSEPDEEYSYLLGPEVTGIIDRYYLTWSYDVGNNGVVYPIITPPEELIIVRPVITYQQLFTRYPDLPLTQPEFRLLEGVVRKVIETYCNQTFTKEVDDSYTILGGDSNSLPLPKRLINLTAVSLLDDVIDSNGDPISYDLTDYVTWDADKPWSIRRRRGFGSTIGSDVTTRRRFFKYPGVYRVRGDWGWENVPQPVVDAAGILIVEYMQPDAKYRDKYITVIRAGDWRMEFEETGMATTGSANADAMLSPFRNLNPGII